MRVMLHRRVRAIQVTSAGVSTRYRVRKQNSGYARDLLLPTFLAGCALGALVVNVIYAVWLLA